MSISKSSYELDEMFSSRFNESSNMDATTPFFTLVSSERYPAGKRQIYEVYTYIIDTETNETRPDILIRHIP